MGFIGSLWKRPSEIKEATEPELKLLFLQLKQESQIKKTNERVTRAFVFSLLPLSSCPLIHFGFQYIHIVILDNLTFLCFIYI